MSKETTETATQPDIEAALSLQIEQNHLEPETSLSLKEKFLPFFDQAQQWKAKAESLVVTDVAQVREMKMAREARLALKEIRVNVEKTRKALKEDSLRKGKAIDGIANILKYLIEPIEEHLEKQEKFAEVMEARRKEALRAERLQELQKYDFQYSNGFDLGTMDEKMFQNLLSGTRKAYEDKIEAERKAEEERIAREKAEAEERERIRQENLRLKAEAEERERVLAAERAAAEEERRALEEKARLEREAAEKEAARIRAEQEAILKKQREEQEAILKKEREERERAESELRARKEAEAKAEADRIAAEEAELSKGDKAKFQDLLADLELLQLKYSFKSKKYKALQVSVNELIEKTIVYGKSKI